MSTGIVSSGANNITELSITVTVADYLELKSCHRSLAAANEHFLWCKGREGGQVLELYKGIIDEEVV